MPSSSQALAEPRVGRTFGRLLDHERAVLRSALRAELEDDYVLRVTTTLDWARS